MSYPIRGLIDLRGQLYRNTANGGPRQRVPLRQKWGGVLHYSGGPQDLALGARAILQRESRYHALERDWSPETGIQHGDGLMYHLAVDAVSGERYLCRDLEDVLWHCGTALNRTAVALHVPLGGSQRASTACRQALAELCEDLEAMGLLDRRNLWGHFELGTTQTCPGTLYREFVLPYRAGARRAPMQAEDVIYFPETDKLLGHGFLRYWERHGGLLQFGYPLSNELQEDGRTVQYFERAVFEYHPEHRGTPYEVQLRRLGAQAAAARGLTGPGIA